MGKESVSKGQRVFRGLALLTFYWSFCSAGACFAAGTALGGDSEQVEVTVIHVDQFAVYGPRVIFYFDPRMDKRKISELSRTADQLRNKKAVITFSSKTDGNRDKRSLLLDIRPSMDRFSTERPTREAARPAEDTRLKAESVIPGQPDDGEAVARLPEPYQSAVPDRKGAQPSDPFPARKAVPKEPDLQEKKAVPQIVHSPSSDQPSSAGIPDKKPGQPSDPFPARKAVPMEPDVQEKKAVPQIVHSPSSDQPSSRLAAVPDKKPSVPGGQSSPITKEEIAAFVRRVLDLNGKKDLPAIMPLYAEKVDYYDRGVVSNDYVRRDLIYYFRNWERITTSLDGDVVMIVLEPELRIAKFLTSYSVKNEKKALTGKTENIWKLQRINGQLKIVDVKQKIIGRGTPGQ